MIIGTHNSLSSYGTRHWSIFGFFSKCQDKTLEEQFYAGCRSFDLRFVKYRGEWRGAHGTRIFDITLEEAFNKLIILSSTDKIRVRILHEDTFIDQPAPTIQELINLVKDYLNVNLELVYIASKKTGNIYLAGECMNSYSFYENDVMSDNDREALCKRVAIMYELKTSDNSINYIGCYDSGGIPLRIFGKQPIIFGYPAQIPFPKLAANALTKIALKKKWKDNDLVVVDFL
jgi:hypothetical protein